MIRRKLDTIRDEVKARMQAGEDLHWRDVWAMTDDGSRSWAHDTLRGWHKAGEIHITRFARGQSGPAMPVYRWGAGADVKRPRAFTDAQKCARWRKANPDKVDIGRKRETFKRRRSPMMDPVHAAMLGYFRRGSGWAKREPRA